MFCKCFTTLQNIAKHMQRYQNSIQSISNAQYTLDYGLQRGNESEGCLACARSTFFETLPAYQILRKIAEFDIDHIKK